MKQLNVPYAIASLGQSVCGGFGAGRRSVVILPIDVSAVACQMHSQLTYQREMDRIDRLMRQQFQKEQKLLQKRMGGRGVNSLLRPNHPSNSTSNADEESESVDIPIENMLKHDLGLYIACGFECATGSMRIAPKVDNGHTGSVSGAMDDGSDQYQDEYAEYDNDEGNMGDVLDVHEWIDEVTYHNRFPILHLETNLPFSYSIKPPLDTHNGGSSGSGTSLLVQHIHHTLDGAIGVADRQDGRDKKNTSTSGDKGVIGVNSDLDSVNSKAYDYRVMNPFSKTSYSSANSINIGSGTGDVDLYTTRRERLYTNVVGVRGTSTDDLASFMFSKCILNNSKYLLNSVHQRNAGIPLDKSELCGLLGLTLNINNMNNTNTSINTRALTNSLFDAVKSDSSAKRYMYCTGISGIGCDIRMGFYIQTLADTWSITSNSTHSSSTNSTQSNANQIRFQLSKYGYSTEELEEMHEQLLDFRHRYDLNEFSLHDDDMNDI